MQPERYYVSVVLHPATKYEKANPITLNVNGGQRLGMSVEEAKALIDQLNQAVEKAKERSQR